MRFLSSCGLPKTKIPADMGAPSMPSCVAFVGIASDGTRKPLKSVRGDEGPPSIAKCLKTGMFFTSLSSSRLRTGGGAPCMGGVSTKSTLWSA